MSDDLPKAQTVITFESCAPRCSTWEAPFGARHRPEACLSFSKVKTVSLFWVEYKRRVLRNNSFQKQARWLSISVKMDVSCGQA